MHQLQRKTWRQPELMLVSQGNINGGVNTGFKEHSHHSGRYYIHPKAGGSPFSVGKQLMISTFIRNIIGA